MRPLLSLGLLLFLALSSAPASQPSSAAAAVVQPPNIVFIFADDLGYGDLGCYGAKDVKTPNLDQLASEGSRFTSFYVGQAVCTASRAAFLTGCYPNRVGMSGALNHTSPNGINPKEELLSELLKVRGYATAAYGKWHLGHHPQFWPTRRGFDEFFGIPYSNDNGPLHPVTRGIPRLPLYEADKVIELDPDQSQFTRRLTERAVGFIEKAGDKPFFLYLPHIMPHVPIFASERWKGTSGRGLYGDVIQELDWSVGQIMAALHRQGLDERTLVIFSSDNGPFLSYGEHAGSAGPLREGKLTTFDGGMRMPFIARWPKRVPAGRVVEEIASTMDIFATLLHLAGAPLPKRQIDGLDLSGLLLGEPGAKGRESYWFYSGDELQAVRVGDWKLHLGHDFLTVAAEPGRGGKPSNFGKMEPRSMEESGVRGIASRHGYRVENQPLALYDLRSDPGESANVAESHPEVVAQLEKVAAQARAELGDAGAPGPEVRPAGDVRAPLPPGVKRLSNLEFSRPPNGALLLDLYLPERAPSQAAPVVLWIHGGAWSKGSKENPPLSWLTTEGVAVASIEYRLTHQGQWPAQLDDCRAALAWVRAHAAQYGLDPRRVFVSGGSAGGHLAAVLGTTSLPAEERPAGVIDFYGPSDLLNMPANLPGPTRTEADLAKSSGALLLGGTVRDHPDLARAASALPQVSAGDAPFLIFHGDQDPQVPLEQSQRLQAALAAAGIESKLVVLPGAGHGGKAFDTEAIRAEIRAFVQMPR